MIKKEISSMGKCVRCIKSIKKRNELCFIHDFKRNKCCICKEVSPVLYQRIVLKNCGHTICKKCLSDHIYSYQWYVGFNTNCPIECPICSTELADNEWANIMDYLVLYNRFQREIVFAYYLNKNWVRQLYKYIEFNEEYNIHQRDDIEEYWHSENGSFLSNLIDVDNEPDVVYFFKVDLFNPRTNYKINYYTFKIDYDDIKRNNEKLHKELVEYVFHPTRILRMGGIDYLDLI